MKPTIPLYNLYRSVVVIAMAPVSYFQEYVPYVLVVIGLI
jgi:hypothetical protein